jgi:hypothetical protein
MPEFITAFVPFALAAAPPAAPSPSEELTLDPQFPDDGEQLQTIGDAVRPTASTARCLTARDGHAIMENERSL